MVGGGGAGWRQQVPRLSLRAAVPANTLRHRGSLAAEVYFLDEPTTGLDPASRAQVHQIVRSLAAGGATVLLTTQYLDEADQLASRIAVIDHGTVIAEGTPGQLKASAGGGILRIRLADPAQRADAGPVLSRLLGMPIQAGTDPAALTATILASPSGRPASERAAAAVTELARSGIAVGEFALGQPSLDEVFLALTGYPGAGSDNAKEERHDRGHHRTGSCRHTGPDGAARRPGRAEAGAARCMGSVGRLRLARPAQDQARP